jgi:hypothetical protein
MARTKKFKSLYLTEVVCDQLRDVSGGDDSETVSTLIELATILKALGFSVRGGSLNLALSMFPASAKASKIRRVYAEKNVQKED